MRAIFAILLYTIARLIWPSLNPRTPGNVSEYDPYVRRYIMLLNTAPKRKRGPVCHAVEYDLEDTQPLYPARLHDLMDAASGDTYQNEGFDTPSGDFDQ